MKESRNNIGCNKSYIRYVGVFLSKILESAALCALAQKCRRLSSVVILDDLPGEQKNAFSDAITFGKIDAISISEFFEVVRCEDEKLANLRYSDSTRKKYLDFCKSFGLFLLLNELDFSPQLIKCWANYCGRDMIVYPKLMEYPQKSENSKVNTIMYVPSKHTSIQMNILPNWSRELLEQYTIDERSRGQAESTLETHKYAYLRFFQFLEQRAVTSCENITPEVLKAFNLADQHSTPQGKKSYNSRIGRFLAFLGERGLVSETLRLALPCKVAKKVSIIKTLNDDEVSTLYFAKDDAESPLSLRDAAIVIIILRMGLRAGDVTSLTYRDISWENRFISISQNKTTKSLLLPMPVMVGNCIYRYLAKGRPMSELEYIFLSHKAPYAKLHSSACADAIKRMLCGSVKSGQGYGSRIVRKTFASRLLKSGNSADSIANLLGHDGNHTVMTYLSTDDEKMRMCALPAGKVAQI
jgi:site-specific recombinase XerD